MIPGFSWIKAAIAAAALIALTTAYFGWRGQQREIGRQEVRAEWTAAALSESESNARETLRRLNKQQENQLAQDRKLAQARADAARDAADADRLRQQNADVVRRWRAALRDPAAGGQCTAAGDAIGVLADVLSRADRRAGVLAAYADAARAAGLKCEADYDALTDSPP